LFEAHHACFDFIRENLIVNLLLLVTLDSDDCRRVFNEQLDYITKTCAKTVSKSYFNYGAYLAGDGGSSYSIQQNSILDADELFINVVDHLQEDDFRRLRQFEGRASITTFLTVIIKRQADALLRERIGRNRSRERAERHGELDSRIHDLMIINNHTADETAEILKTNYNIQISADELRERRRCFLGRDGTHKSCADTETSWGESGELVVVRRDNPETELTGHIQNDRRRDLLADLIEGLNGEERLLVKLRFPLSDDTVPYDIDRIAAMVGLTPQQVDRKLRRILQSCREKLLRKGIKLEDLL